MKEMNTEFEATFAKIDKEAVRERLENLGAELIVAESLQVRKVFELPEYKSNGFLRVRMEITGKVMMTLKIFTEETISGQKELEVEVGNFDNTVSMLKLLGFREKAYQETKRELWRLNDVEIMIDEWPFLEPFIEIEGANEEAVRAIAEKLGFDYSEAIFGPVTIQYSQKYNLEEDLINNKTPKIIFDMENPFVRPNATA